MFCSGAPLDCDSCNHSDSKVDTVRVQLGNITWPEQQLQPTRGKENITPPSSAATLDRKIGRVLCPNVEEELARRQRSAQEREEALQKQLAEEASLAEHGRQEEARRRWADLEARRGAKEAVRLEEEQRNAELQERARLEVQAQDEQNELFDFLEANSFTNVNDRRRRYMRTSCPLHVAVSQGKEEIVRLLVAYRADLTAKDSSGKTPLQLAEKSSRKGLRNGVLDALSATHS